MTIDNGGWTLVGRSVANGAAAGDFGWSDDHGAVTRESDPFSMDPTKHGLTFTEVLFGAYSTGMQLGPHAYKHTVPADFLTRAKSTGIEPAGGAATVLGGCSPVAPPSMLSWLGYTQDPEKFWFQDKDVNESFGLHPDGWSTNGAGPCSYTGLLDGKQGMILVR
jgi:hypothetical protein